MRKQKITADHFQKPLAYLAENMVEYCDGKDLSHVAAVYDCALKDIISATPSEHLKKYCTNFFSNKFFGLLEEKFGITKESVEDSRKAEENEHESNEIHDRFARDVNAFSSSVYGFYVCHNPDALQAVESSDRKIIWTSVLNVLCFLIGGRLLALLLLFIPMIISDTFSLTWLGNISSTVNDFIIPFCGCFVVLWISKKWHKNKISFGKTCRKTGIILVVGFVLAFSVCPFVSSYELLMQGKLMLSYIVSVIETFYVFADPLIYFFVVVLNIACGIFLIVFGSKSIKK